MIAEFFSSDNAFFTVESDDIALSGRQISENLKSFSITETMDGLPQGSLVFDDQTDIYSRILRTGAKLKLSWGYRDEITRPESLIEKQINFDEITGRLVRRGLEGFITSPSGGGSNTGQVTYNCNFTSYGFRGDRHSRVFDSGSKADVVSSVLSELGVPSDRIFINFAQGQDKLSTRRSVRQDETSFRFLTRLAREWRALFQIAATGRGTPAAIFIDPDKIGTTPWPQWVTEGKGSSHVIGYRGQVSNVNSYRWTSNESESGVGANVQVEFVDGQPVFRRYVADQEKVITYRLVPERIQEAFNTTGGEFENTIALAKDLLSAKDFAEVERFFVAVETTTAPQGYGYRINAKMLGNPLFCPPNQVIINNGFPDRLGGSQSKFYLNTVTHTIDTSGYLMDVNIVDVFALSPIGQPIL